MDLQPPLVVEKKFDSEEFDNKLKDIRNLEAQIHHQNEMYRRPLQNKRKDIIFKLLKENLKVGSFLDIGCAEGLFNDFAYKMGSDCSVGIDISEKNFFDKWSAHFRKYKQLHRSEFTKLSEDVLNNI